MAPPVLVRKVRDNSEEVKRFFNIALREPDPTVFEPLLQTDK